MVQGLLMLEVKKNPTVSGAETKQRLDDAGFIYYYWTQQVFTKHSSHNIVNHKLKRNIRILHVYYTYIYYFKQVRSHGHVNHVNHGPVEDPKG